VPNPFKEGLGYDKLTTFETDNFAIEKSRIAQYDLPFAGLIIQAQSKKGVGSVKASEAKKATPDCPPRILPIPINHMIQRLDEDRHSPSENETLAKGGVKLPKIVR
jgi:hypothetical protein